MDLLAEGVGRIWCPSRGAVDEGRQFVCGVLEQPLAPLSPWLLLCGPSDGRAAGCWQGVQSSPHSSHHLHGAQELCSRHLCGPLKNEGLPKMSEV